MNLGSLASYWTTQLTSVGTFAKLLAMLAGFILVFYSLWSWYHLQKRQQPAGWAIAGIVIGTLMVAIPALLMISSNTLTGSTATGLSSIGVN